MAVRLSVTPGGIRLDLRVIPRAPHDAIAGERDGRLVVRVTAPPVDRAANDAVVELVARKLDLFRRAVEEDWLIVLSHERRHPVGRLVPDRDRFRYEPI